MTVLGKVLKLGIVTGAVLVCTVGSSVTASQPASSTFKCAGPKTAKLGSTFTVTCSGFKPHGQYGVDMGKSGTGSGFGGGGPSIANSHGQFVFTFGPAASYGAWTTKNAGTYTEGIYTASGSKLLASYSTVVK